MTDAATKGNKDALLSAPSHAARELDRDLEAAQIAKKTSEGKIDFHAFRVAFVTLVLESGANPIEAQALARHLSPNITMERYARARKVRLAEVAETVGQMVQPSKIYGAGGKG